MACPRGFSFGRPSGTASTYLRALANFITERRTICTLLRVPGFSFRLNSSRSSSAAALPSTLVMGSSPNFGSRVLARTDS